MSRSTAETVNPLVCSERSRAPTKSPSLMQDKVYEYYDKRTRGRQTIAEKRIVDSVKSNRFVDYISRRSDLPYPMTPSLKNFSSYKEYLDGFKAYIELVLYIDSCQDNRNIKSSKEELKNVNTNVAEFIKRRIEKNLRQNQRKAAKKQLEKAANNSSDIVNTPSIAPTQIIADKAANIISEAVDKMEGLASQPINILKHVVITADAKKVNKKVSNIKEDTSDGFKIEQRSVLPSKVAILPQNPVDSSSLPQTGVVGLGAPLYLPSANTILPLTITEKANKNLFGKDYCFISRKDDIDSFKKLTPNDKRNLCKLVKDELQHAKVKRHVKELERLKSLIIDLESEWKSTDKKITQEFLDRI